MDDFQITGKVQTITTDNASNFVKAFKISTEENELLFHRFLDEEDNNHKEIKDQLKLKNIDINDMLEFAIDEFVILPKHIRCLAHTANLICTNDFAKNLKDTPDTVFKSSYKKLVAKCNKLWIGQNMSSNKADYVKQQLNKYLTTPGATRWNSLYDALTDIAKHLKENKSKMDNICDFFGIKKFSANEIAFLIDFTAVLSILAQFLDVIQGEKEVYSGIVLPMVKKLMTKLNEFLLSDSMTSRTTASLLLEGVNKRLRFFFLSYILN
jgi:REP element-mobilizing transposase RayT